MSVMKINLKSGKTCPFSRIKPGEVFKMPDSSTYFLKTESTGKSQSMAPGDPVMHSGFNVINLDNFRVGTITWDDTPVEPLFSELRLSKKSDDQI